jgi:thiol-disulfide isomerase/thioredoxin
MTTVVRFLLAAVMVAAVLGRPRAGAGEFAMDVGTADIRLGPHVSGPQVTEQSLAHRVVLLEFWGLNCPPCIRSMPMLDELHRSFGPQGLVIVGAHAQGGTAADIGPKVKELGVGFTIVEQAMVQGGMDFQGIPHCMLFDHAGTCVFRGSPFEVGDAVARAVADAPAAVMEGRKLVKLAALEKLLIDERSFGAVLKKARGMIAAKDAETAAEARFVVERLESRGRRMLDEARTIGPGDPLGAVGLAQRCSATFEGSDLGVEAATLLRTWKKDKAFQDSLRARQQLANLEAIQAAASRGGGAGGGVPPALSGRVRSLVQSIHLAAPDSPIAERATVIAGELGVKIAAKTP